MAYANNNGNGFAYINRNNSESEKAPYFKGFVKLSPELVEYINEAETDAEGNVMLDMALWKRDNGASGTVSIPFKARKQNEEKVAKVVATKKAAKPKAKATDDMSEDF